MADRQIINFSASTGILQTTLFGCQQETGGDGSTQKIPFSDIREKITITGLTQSEITSLPSPITGQLALASDTLQLLFFNGSSWQISG